MHIDIYRHSLIAQLVEPCTGIAEVRFPLKPGFFQDFFIAPAFTQHLLTARKLCSAGLSSVKYVSFTYSLSHT